MRNVYINKIAVCLPNKPVSNEAMENHILVSLEEETHQGIGQLF